MIYNTSCLSARDVKSCKGIVLWGHAWFLDFFQKVYVCMLYKYKEKFVILQSIETIQYLGVKTMLA